MADHQQLELEKDAQLQKKGREIENLQSKLKVRINVCNLSTVEPLYCGHFGTS